MKKRKSFLEKPKQVKVSEEMMLALARDLKEGHDAKVYNLHYWPAAREVVTLFYKED